MSCTMQTGVSHRRTGQHPFGGGQTEFCPNGFSGGGVVAEIFRDPYYVGGGSSRNLEIFRDPYYVGGRIFSVSGSGGP